MRPLDRRHLEYGQRPARRGGRMGLHAIRAGHALLRLHLQVEQDWSAYVKERKAADPQVKTIKVGHSQEKTHRYMQNALRDKEFRASGVKFDEL